MPSILVTPETLTASVLDGPILGGVQLPRPNSTKAPTEADTQTVTLGNGSERVYTRGTRRVYTLGWSRLLEEDVATLRDLMADPVTTYLHVDGTAPVYVTTTGGMTEELVAGTYPIRYAVEITLREQDLRS